MTERATRIRQVLETHREDYDRDCDSHDGCACEDPGLMLWDRYETDWGEAARANRQIWLDHVTAKVIEAIEPW